MCSNYTESTCPAIIWRSALGLDIFSIAVFHCLRGALPGKGIVFAHLKALLNPGGVLFGSTVLRRGVHGNVPADMFMHFLNARRLFCNEHDELDGLVHTLEQHLTDVRIEVVGCVALFSGRLSDV
jgi:hypothetical protein